MSDKDSIQEAREWGESYASWGDNGLVDRLADALEARQVDEAALAKVILKHRYMEYPAGLCSCGVDSVGLDRVHEDHMARAVVEFLGERHEPEPDAPQPSESLVCEPRQDSTLLWEGTSSASTYPAYEHDDAEESEAEYKDHAATVASEPEWEYRATTDNGAFVGESRTTPEHAVQALQEAVDEYPIVLDEQGVKVERRPRSPWLPVEGGSK